MLALLPLVFSAGITRDSFGVPHIRATSWAQAFEMAGYAVAEDRLWQMENSRRLATGTMAEVFGPDFVASDKDVLRVAYTQSELTAQVRKLPERIQTAVSAYAAGINRFIREGRLPKEYAESGFQPRPWKPEDSAAIAVRMLQTFGRGGAGEIRNMALYGYLQTQPALKGHESDVLNDLAWFNDSRATTTIADEDVKSRVNFSSPTPSVTASHLAMLPKASLIELLPGIRVAMREESTRVAASVSAPYKSGSYCIVAAPKRSSKGVPLLLSGPQMGFRQPSIVHEMSLDAPGVKAVGMDIPGVPGIIVGHTDFMAWGLTTGVADTEDIYFTSKKGDGYELAGQVKPILTVPFEIKVKGGETVKLEQARTEWGPVVLALRSGTIFIRRSSFWKRELESFDAFFGLYQAKSVKDIVASTDKATLNFNFFFATTKGDIGHRYVGNVPLRSSEVDPRFPTPADPKFDWKGYIPKDKLPQVINPKSGLLVNWNNKPVSWWPNFDTPVWGRIFRNSVLLERLTKPKLNTSDLENAISNAARTDYNFRSFQRLLASCGYSAFDGKLIDGSGEAAFYLRFFDVLRSEIFSSSIGSLISPDNFKQAIQPSLMLNALEGKTRFNFLGSRTKEEVIKAALDKVRQEFAKKDTPLYKAGRIAVQGEEPILYSDRGTYIQVIELFKVPKGRNVLPPGIAESGPHRTDQASLARNWRFKPMHY
ncbi:MAG: penicillin acylase family protein [Fimbriimonadaceae bacterium]